MRVKLFFVLCLLALCNIITMAQGVISPSLEIEARQKAINNKFSKNIQICQQFRQQIETVESPERTAKEVMKQMQGIPDSEANKVLTQLIAQIQEKKIDLPNGRYGSTEQFVEASFLWEEFNRIHCKEILAGQKRADWEKALRQEIKIYEKEKLKEDYLLERWHPSATVPSNNPSKLFQPFNWIFYVLLVMSGLIIIILRIKLRKK